MTPDAVLDHYLHPRNVGKLATPDGVGTVRDPAQGDSLSLAIEVDDVYKATEDIRARDGKILREAGPMNAGTTIIAFVEDPDGYPIELIGRKTL